MKRGKVERISEGEKGRQKPAEAKELCLVRMKLTNVTRKFFT